jgi:peptidoglycan hydrolase CwlO-like protein
MVNRLDKLPSYLESDQASLLNTQQQLEQAKALQFEPFPQEQELTEKVQRLTELTQELSLDKKSQQSQEGEEKAEKPAADAPKSLADRLREARAAIAGRNSTQQPNPRRVAMEH